LLKYAAKPGDDQIWVGRAYAKNQPKTLGEGYLSKKTLEEEQQKVNDDAQDLMK
jgi:hypothetical protein